MKLCIIEEPTEAIASRANCLLPAISVFQGSVANFFKIAIILNGGYFNLKYSRWLFPFGVGCF